MLISDFADNGKGCHSMRLGYTVLYIVLIVAVNSGFTVVPLVEFLGGEKWPPLSLLVGFIFVVRDFA